MDGLLSKLPKGKKLQTRDEILDFKKKFSSWFNVYEEELQNVQLAKEQKLEEDAIRIKQEGIRLPGRFQILLVN